MLVVRNKNYKLPATSIPNLVSGSRLPLLEKGDVTAEEGFCMQAAYHFQKFGIRIETVKLFFFPVMTYRKEVKY